MNIDNEKIDKWKEILKTFHETNPEKPERVGFITDKDHLVEVANVSDKPTEGFLVSPLMVIEYTENQPSWATWHTHPGTSANLSLDDYPTFTVYDEMVHFIVGKDSVRCYQYDPKVKAIVDR